MLSTSKYQFNGPLRRNEANPRYFTDGSGSSIYLTGSHTWAVMQDIWLSGEERIYTDYNAFLQMLEDNNHNFLRFWQWQQFQYAPWNEVTSLFDPQPYMRTGPGNAIDGNPRYDLMVWNEEYFQRLRDRVEAAGKRGIYVSVMLFEGWGIKWASPEQNPWLGHPMHPDNNVNNVTDNPVVENGRAWDFYSLNCPELMCWQEAYVRKCIETLNDLDNVLWEVCNEVPWRKEAMDWSEHICGFIKKVESTLPKKHPVGITAEGGDQNNEDLFATDADWISPSNGRLLEYRYNPPVGDGRKVVLTDTDHLWGHGGEVEWIWKSVTRGLNVLFMDPWQPIPGEMDYWQDGDTTKNQRYYHEWDAIRRNMGYAKRLLDAMDLNMCIPHGELCTSGYCIADPGSEYLIFLPEGGCEGLDLWEHPGKYSVRWLSPVTGKSVKGPDIYGKTRHVLESPFNGMAVLYLKKTV